MSYVDARNWLLQWQGDLEVKSLLASMLGTSALWDSSQDNEAGLLRKRVLTLVSQLLFVL
jgi:hypothetical protein